MSNIQRYLQSDEHPTRFLCADRGYSTAGWFHPELSMRYEEERYQLQSSWHETYEASTTPWKSPADESLTVDHDSLSSGGAWSPQTSESFPTKELAHGASFWLADGLHSYETDDRFNSCASFPGNQYFNDHSSFEYIAPSKIQPHDDAGSHADAEADPDLEIFSIDPKHHLPAGACYAQASEGGLAQPSSTVSALADDSGLGSSIQGTSIRSPSICGEDEADMDDGHKDDEDSEYNPTKRRTKASKCCRTTRITKSASPKNSKRSLRKPTGPLAKPAKIARHTPNSAPPTSSQSSHSCNVCYQTLPSPSTLNKHVMTMHTRPFSCVFARYGCPSTFGAKNEWKRHVSSQHLRPGVYRCDMSTCVPQPRHQRRKSSSSHTSKDNETDGFNEFNRKDLFTQHIRRMHSPTAKGEKDLFESNLESVRKRCWVKLHDIPPRSMCGFCMHEGKSVFFQGKGAWEDRMEHIGRHLERGEKEEDEDTLLRQWMIGEDLLRWEQGSGQWRVVGMGGKRKATGDEDAEGDSE